MKSIPAWLIMMSLCSSGAAAEANDLKRSRPDPADVPTVVHIGIFLRDIDRISDTDENATAELMLTLRWKDPRLAHAGEDVRAVALDEIWTPRIDLLNAENVTKRLADIAQVSPDGAVLYRQRFSGTFDTDFDLHSFPFDEQFLEFRVVFPDLPPAKLMLVIDEETTGEADKFSLPDWDAEPGTFQVIHSQVVSGRPCGAIVYRTMIVRRLHYYLWKLILPLVLIVSMSWAAFWLEPTNVGAQLGVASSAVLTLIAYRFMLSNLLPRVSYVTRMDQFILASTAIVFLAFIEVVFTSVLIERGRTTLVRRMDGWSRFLFPFAYALVCVAIVVH